MKTLAEINEANRARWGQTSDAFKESEHPRKGNGEFGRSSEGGYSTKFLSEKAKVEGRITNLKARAEKLRGKAGYADAVHAWISAIKAGENQGYFFERSSK
jgi:hypothetical protein